MRTQCTRDLPKVGGHYGYFDMDHGLICYSGALGEDVAVCAGALSRTEPDSVILLNDRHTWKS